SFFFTSTFITVIFTLSLHDALPIFMFFAFLLMCDFGNTTNGASGLGQQFQFLQKTFGLSLSIALAGRQANACSIVAEGNALGSGDRKSTRLNSSHVSISYAVFCLKK